MNKRITQEYLKSILHYDPKTGDFTRTKRGRGGGGVVGDIAGSYSYGYILIRVKYKSYTAHSLAFLYMTGKFPKDAIDHINQIKDDNQWSNLREATNAQNQANVGLQTNNTSGFKGVSLHKPSNKWRVSIGFKGKNFHLGYYTNINEAARTYNEAALKYYGEFACLNEVMNDEIM